MNVYLIFKRINSNSHMIAQRWRFNVVDGRIDRIQSSSVVVPMIDIHEDHNKNKQGK